MEATFFNKYTNYQSSHCRTDVFTLLNHDHFITKATLSVSVYDETRHFDWSLDRVEVCNEDRYVKVANYWFSSDVISE